MQSFAKIKPLRNDDCALSFSDIGKSYQIREFLKWKICILTLFAKIKFSRKFPNSQYSILHI